MMRLENRHQRLLPWGRFVGRQALFLAASLGVLGVSLYGGMAGFHYLEHLGWLDSLVNATMLLGGEGPLAQPQTVAGKYFASFYAVYSGVVFLVAFGILVTPALHRLFHRFHLAEDGDAPAHAAARAPRRAPGRRA